MTSTTQEFFNASLDHTSDGAYSTSIEQTTDQTVVFTSTSQFLTSTAQEFSSTSLDHTSDAAYSTSIVPTTDQTVMFETANRKHMCC